MQPTVLFAFTARNLRALFSAELLFRVSHSQASLFFLLVTADTQHTLQLWGPPRPRDPGCMQLSGLCWDTTAHESFLIRPRVLAQFPSFKGLECSTHCSRKPDICASFHTTGKLSHFPRMYLFSPEVSPVVRRGVLAKALRKPQGKTCSGF